MVLRTFSWKRGKFLSFYCYAITVRFVGFSKVSRVSRFIVAVTVTIRVRFSDRFGIGFGVGQYSPDFGTGEVYLAVLNNSRAC